MKTKRLAEFSLSFLLSMVSLLVVSVPVVHASHVTVGTGAKRFLYNPLVTMGITIVATALIIVIARHYNRINAKR